VPEVKNEITKGAVLPVEVQPMPEPDERDFLLRTAFDKLGDVIQKLAQEIPTIEASHKPKIAHISIEPVEVLQALSGVLNGGAAPPATPPPIAGPGGSADNGRMEARVAKLETLSEKTGERLNAIDLRLVKIETRLDHIDGKLSTEMATKDGMKAAITEAKNSIIMWVVSAIFIAQLLPALLKKFGL
jgi:hypothetical protein